MKKLVIIIVSVFVINTINAQYHHTASNDANNEIVFTKSVPKVSTISKEKLSYSESLKAFDQAITIQNLENTIVSYNLKQDPIYDNSEKASYKVSFNNKNARAIVIYNNDGDIITTKEKYKNVKLPYQLTASIIKNHPDFYIKNAIVHKNFKMGFGIKTIYEVVISGGGKTKTLKFVN